MDKLKNRTCIPCRGGVAPLTTDEAGSMLSQVDGWELIESASKIRRTFMFKTFIQAQTFALKIGNIAESEGHHPDISYGWGYCVAVFYTHKINGLHENDFIMAAKVNEIA